MAADSDLVAVTPAEKAVVVVLVFVTGALQRYARRQIFRFMRSR